MTIGDNIRREMTRRGLTVSELARRSGVERSRLHRVVTSETLHPQTDLVERVADAMGVSVAELMGRPGPRAVAAGRVVAVPIVRVPAQAGDDWIWEQTGASVAVDEDIARGRDLYAIAVLGTRMKPDILSGDIVIFDKWSRAPNDGQMVVVTDGDQALVRWWQRGQRGRPLLTSNEGDQLESNGAVLEGVVVEVRRRFPAAPPPSAT